MRSLEAKSMCSCVSIIIKKRNQKENNNTITVDIASPWDHRVYEKEGEKIEKYQDLDIIIIIIIIIIITIMHWKAVYLILDAYKLVWLIFLVQL